MGTKLISFTVITVISILLFIGVSWGGSFSLSAATWSQSICFFAFTCYVLWKLEKSQIERLPIVLAVVAIMLGRMLPILPIMISDFTGAWIYMIVNIICLISIILGAICFHEKRSSVYTLSIIIMLMLNTLALNQWEQMVIGKGCNIIV